MLALHNRNSLSLNALLHTGLRYLKSRFSANFGVLFFSPVSEGLVHFLLERHRPFVFATLN